MASSPPLAKKRLLDSQDSNQSDFLHHVLRSGTVGAGFDTEKDGTLVWTEDVKEALEDMIVVQRFCKLILKLKFHPDELKNNVIIQAARMLLMDKIFPCK